MEFATGKANANSSNSNLVQAFHELGGDDMIHTHRHGEAFCIFQAPRRQLNDSIPLLESYESEGCFRGADSVELLAQQDLTVIAPTFSPDDPESALDRLHHMENEWRTPSDTWVHQAVDQSATPRSRCRPRHL